MTKKQMLITLVSLFVSVGLVLGALLVSSRDESQSNPEKPITTEQLSAKNGKDGQDEKFSEGVEHLWILKSRAKLPCFNEVLDR